MSYKFFKTKFLLVFALSIDLNGLYLLGALGKALPGRAYAGAFGTAGNITIGGYDSELDIAYVMYYFSGGGYGGNWFGDGLSKWC